jgi:biotin-dependent carboxylase-like uncharacterized protein
MGFKVINPGLLATIQDNGRFGYQHMGVTTGGPLDEYAFSWANHLLGNTTGAAALEITFGGLELLVQINTNISVTGADLGATINGQRIEHWRTHRVKAGDRLKFHSPQTGLRAYLAVSGGFEIPQLLGSCSTVTREGIGGLVSNGAKLKPEDRLPCAEAPPQQVNAVPTEDIPDYRKHLELGLIEGYQIADFSSEQLRRFFGSEYQITPDIDRMGYRLKGEAISATRSGIISEGIAAGAVQIPADGQPIVLMCDRQTIGGYPKPGCISRLGMGQLAQRGPESSVRFYPMDVSMAQAQRLAFKRHLKLFDFQHFA